MLTKEFVVSLREAAPYINAFRKKTFVIALSGETLAHGQFAGVAKDICLLASLGVRLALVHGSRPQIEALLNQRGQANIFHQGQRVTDRAAIDSVKQASGGARHDIEAALSMGMPNSPMHGAHLRVASGNFFTAKPLGVLDGIDMQFTGKLRRIDVSGMQKRLSRGELVLLTPIGYSLNGEAFNLVMENVATETSIALQAEKLIFMVSGKGAVSAEGNHVKTLSAEQAEQLLQTSVQAEDTATYLPYAIHATRAGVPRVHLVSAEEDGALLAELFTHEGTGTLITREPVVNIRSAKFGDIDLIRKLIAPLEAEGVLVKRSSEYLRQKIAHYSLIERDRRVYGCVAMYVFPASSMAELACLVVAPQKQAYGYGALLLSYVEQQARAQNISAIFVLTTQTAHWFVERGFVETDISQLPMEKQNLYNYERRSKVFIKKL